MSNTHELLCQSPSSWMPEMRPVSGPLWASEHGGSERRQGQQVRPNPPGAKAWPGHLRSSGPPLGGRVTAVQTKDRTTPGPLCPRLTSKTTLLNFPWKRVLREAQQAMATATKGPRAPDSSAHAVACLSSPGGAGSASPKRGTCSYTSPTRPSHTASGKHIPATDSEPAALSRHWSFTSPCLRGPG